MATIDFRRSQPPGLRRRKEAPVPDPLDPYASYLPGAGFPSARIARLRKARPERASNRQAILKFLRWQTWYGRRLALQTRLCGWTASAAEAVETLETITEAAILHAGQPWSVPRPGRHGDVIARLAAAHPEDGPFVEEQGFLTSRGRFVDRAEAGRIALAAGQTPALRRGNELYSEDLW